MKCPHCGEEIVGAGIVAYIRIGEQFTGIVLGSGSIANGQIIPQGDMLPIFEDGKWWADYSSYRQHRETKERAKSQPHE